MAVFKEGGNAPFAWRNVKQYQLLKAACMCAVLLLLFPFASTDAATEAEIRKSIMENCPRATAEFDSLSPEGKEELLPFLRLVLELAPGVEGLPPPAPGNAPVIPGQAQPSLLSRVNPSLGQDLVRSLEPRRVLEAKRCVIPLLERSGSRAFEAVPVIIRLSLDKTLPFDFLDALDSAAWRITVSASRDTGCGALGPVFEEIYPLLKEQSTSLPSNVFVQTGGCSADYLLNHLKGTGEETGRRLTDMLLNIDDTGHRTGLRFIEFAGDQTDDRLRITALRVLAALEPFYHESLMPVLRMMPESQGDVRKEVLSTLRAIFSKKTLPVSESLQNELLDRLFSGFEQSTGPERDVMQEGIELFESFPDPWRERLKNLAVSPDADLRKRSIILLGRGSLSESDVSFVLKRALSEPDTGAELAAIEVLGRQLPFQQKIIQAFLQILKGSAMKDDVSAHQRRVCAVASALRSSGLGKPLSAKTLQPFSRYFTGFLKYYDFAGRLGGCDSPLVLMAAYPEPALGDILKMLKETDAAAQEKAVSVLAAMKPLPGRAVQPLLDHFKTGHPKTLEAAGKVLIAGAGETALTKLKGMLKTVRPEQKVIIAETLLRGGYQGGEVKNVLKDAWQSQSCDLQARIFFDLLRVSGSDGAGEMNSRMVSCLVESSLNRENTFKVAAQLAPVAKGSEDERRIRQFLTRTDVDPGLQIALLKRAVELGLDRNEAGRITLNMLAHVEIPFKITLLQHIVQFPEESQNARPLLESYMRDSGSEALAIQALHALLELAPSGVDFVQILRRELDTGRAFTAQQAILSAAPLRVIPSLLALLHDDNVAIREWALVQLGRIEDRSGETETELSAILKAPRDPTERYLAALALFRLRTSGDPAFAAIRKEITGRFREQLLDERFSDEQKGVFGRVAENPASFLERQTARSLVKGARHP